ncbi:hypothetical protein HMPREF9126_0277 [Parvimonas sp. oral taxon 110 str. F0139]|nr:hypothetical protein HMPREF9126_0277 [Parvimonas sp. oral taxon 110 str. F0139]
MDILVISRRKDGEKEENKVKNKKINYSKKDKVFKNTVLVLFLLNSFFIIFLFLLIQGF